MLLEIKKHINTHASVLNVFVAVIATVIAIAVIMMVEF